ncbi:MAG: hypothetical protein WA130_09105 [Candidatus Methanoperedens sp.]
MNILRSFIVLFVLMSVISMSILPVSAPGLTLSLSSSSLEKNKPAAYTGSMIFNSTAPDIQYRYLKVIIPEKYEMTYPVAGTLMGTFTISEGTNDKVRIRMYSTGTTPQKVKFNFSINGGAYNDFNPSFVQETGLVYNYSYNSNILRYLEPSNANGGVGYVEFVLGSLGPVTKLNKVMVESVALKNPSAGTYTWNAEARDVSGSSSNVSSGSFSVTIT